MVRAAAGALVISWLATAALAIEPEALPAPVSMPGPAAIAAPDVTPTSAAPTDAVQVAPPPQPAPPITATPAASPDSSAQAVDVPAKPSAGAAAAAPAQATPGPATPPAIAAIPDPAVASAGVDTARLDLIRQSLPVPSQPPAADDADGLDRAAAARFYASAEARPLWTSGDALSPRGEQLLAELDRAGEWGLDPKAFARPGKTTGLAPAEAVQAELALTLSALAYARHARGGRISEPAKQLSSYLDRTPQVRDPAIVLAELAKAADAATALRAQHPRHPQFEKLRQRYLAMLAETGASPAVERIPPGPMLKPGLKHPHVSLVRRRLERPAAADADETLFDPDLVEAVKAFQKEKGLPPDGYVGNGTRAAFDDVETSSPGRLLANMEQWRWMPDDLGDFYVTVNIPEFMLRIVKGGAVVHEERVITGLPDKQSPVFSDEIELVTFHPRWNVPESIKVRELYPSLARGGTSFQRQGLKLSQNGRMVDPASVDWSTADIRRFDVHQPPGSSNVLGVLKFSFPNKHLVYMHDTGTKGLFDEASRTFSHGCMRVRNPVRLAEILLAADKGWDSAKIQELLATQPIENPVTLDRKVPVHATYFTAWVDAEGKEHVARDVYGHEKRITQALAGQWAEIARGPDHLAPVTYGAARYTSSQGNFFDGVIGNVFGGF
ncbi:MAG: L,D-transpeptidase family protein [Hyphomicrobium sp.]